MRRVFFNLAILLVPAMLLSACSAHLGLSRIFGSGSSASSGGSGAAKATKVPDSGVTAISIANGHYRPKNVTIKAGTTLTWTNNGSVPESVTSDTPGLFDSGSISPGATFSETFSSQGTFPYHSTAGTAIYGSITVTP